MRPVVLSLALLFVLGHGPPTAQARDNSRRRAWRNAAATKAGKWVRGGRARLKRLRRPRVKNKSVGELSTTSLLVGSTDQVTRLSAQAAQVVTPFTGVGAVGLGITSARDLARAGREKSAEKALDATHGLAWSLQGSTALLRLSQIRGAWIPKLAKAAGVVGGGIQTGVGLYRVASGLPLRGRKLRGERVITGSLDVGAGVCWAASSCAIAAPYTLGAFAVFTGARMAYTNRAALKQLARGLAQKGKQRLRRRAVAAH